MSKFISKFAPAIDAMLEYRVALGLSDASPINLLGRFDRYCAEHYSGNDTLTKEMVFGWLANRAENQEKGIGDGANAIRGFGEYLNAIGKTSYILPDGFYPIKSDFVPYIFTDKELRVLFSAIDALPRKGNSTESFVAPVMFRLIYTCGLRPNEGRALLSENVNLDNGEIYVTNTKKKKDRIVVMSSDMRDLCRKYRSHELPDSEYFFPRYDGNAYTGAQTDRLFKKCWVDANPGIAELPSVRIYDLRHRFASARLNRWLDEGADLNNKLAYLRAYMGHQHLSETAYYIHVLPENLVKSAGVDWSALSAVLPEVDVWNA